VIHILFGLWLAWQSLSPEALQHLNAGREAEKQRRIFEGSLTGPLGRSKKMSFLVSANREEEDVQAIVFAEGLSGTIQTTVLAPARNTEISGSLTRLIGEDHLISIRGLYTDRAIHNQKEETDVG